MRRFIYFLLIIFLFAACFFMLNSCGNSNDEDAENSGDTRVLNVYNWGEYIADGSEGSIDANLAFEEYYYQKYHRRVEVVYSTYATNEDMFNKISSGAGSAYDIVVPSEYMIERMINYKSGSLLHKYNVAEEIENFKYIDPNYTGKFFDPENQYAVPYTYGTVGIIYNETMVDPSDYEKQSWDLLFNPKYKGKILQFNNPRDGLATAMYRLGLDINTTNKKDWEKALKLLSDQKSLVQAYVSDEIYNKMISNSASIATYYVGDYISMKPSNENLQFYYPKEGTNIFIDAMCILESSKNKDLAKEYINFMLTEDIATENAIFIGYATPNILVRNNEYYAEEMGKEAMHILYEQDHLVNNDYPFDPYYHDFTQDMHDYTNSLWESLKTQNATEPWVHVSTVIIITALGGFVGYNTYIKKKRSKDYRLRDKAKIKATRK